MNGITNSPSANATEVSATGTPMLPQLGVIFDHNVNRRVMQFRRPLIIALVLVGAASAQTTEDALRSRIAGVRYSPLAEAARVQGD